MAFGRFGVVVCMLMGGAQAALADAKDPQALFSVGQYQAAALAAAQIHDADNLAFAAKSLAAQAVLTEDPAQTAVLAKNVRTHAEQALAIDPNHVEAQLQLAIAIWLEGRSTGAVESYLRGLPAKGRDVLYAALEDAGDDRLERAWAHALLGAWHMEVWRRGGARGAQIYGADIYKGAVHFNTALDLAPDEASIATQCAVAYLALDAQAYGEHARIALDRALAAQADDAFELAMQAEAEVLRTALRAGDHRTVEQTVARFVEG